MSEAKLPFGPPPVLPDIQVQLGEYLVDPTRLPIHHTESSQLFWRRKPNALDLLNYDYSPLATTLKVHRDPLSGQIIEFRELPVLNAGLTAKNSTSLNRAPGPPSETTRGNASNCPFWPGGFADPFVNLPVENNIDLNNDLLTVPPGFSRGLNFCSDGFTLSTDSSETTAESIELRGDTDEIDSAVVNLMSVVEKEHNLLGLWSDNKSVSAAEKPKMIELSAVESDIIIDEPAIPVLNITKTLPLKQTPGKTRWAEEIDIQQPVNDFNERIPDLAHKYDFELDVFQKQAILKLEEHQHVFVAAHTSAGKTVVAEYAIALSQKHMTRAIYTSPVKALSNQKYRDFKMTFGDVGLITGDFQINQTASCLIMTTEILRSMLYCGSDVTRDLEFVIFDEVHYINNEDRGHVWEEVLILLPANVIIVMLSATVPNTLDFAGWVGMTKKRKVYVIKTERRPVPLTHHLYTGCGGKTRSNQFLIVNADGNFVSEGYQKAKNSIVKKNTLSGKQFYTENQEKTMWSGLIAHLKKEELLPVVAFTLSRKRCDRNASMLTNVDFNFAREQNYVRKYFDNCIQKLKDPDRQLPQVINMKSLLERGIGVHHSGILPILKEIVELLFQQGYVKLLFATETFAMGVNMPTRTVLFDAVNKFDGKSVRPLWPAEYIQMAGRAGRRGKDRTGDVIIICKGEVPPEDDLKRMMLGKPEKLISQFKLTYRMVLKLLQVEGLTIEKMMFHSFLEYKHTSQNDVFRQRLDEAKAYLNKFTLSKSKRTYDDFFLTALHYFKIRACVWSRIIEKWATKELVLGRFLLINHLDHYNKIAVLLKITKQLKYVVLVLNDKVTSDVTLDEEIVKMVPKDQYFSLPYSFKELWHKMISLTVDEIYQSDSIGEHRVLTIDADDIEAVVDKTMKMDSKFTDLVLTDWEKRRIPRFQNDPPGQSCNKVIQELTKYTQDVKSGNVHLECLDMRNDLRINDMEDVEDLNRLERARSDVAKNLDCTRIMNFVSQFKNIFERKILEEYIDCLDWQFGDESLKLNSNKEQMKCLLRKLRYIDDSDNVQLKGCFACEMGTNELIITELVFNNIFDNMQPAEVAAVLSSLVFQAKTRSKPVLTKSLEKAQQEVQKIDEQIRLLEKEYRIEQQEDLNFGLVEVVYDWASDKPFAEIMNKTDVQEGIIVRCIQQLYEILRDIKDAAARIIGEPVLQAKMEEASNAIKRDIVFAQSLYTQKVEVAP